MIGLGTRVTLDLSNSYTKSDVDIIGTQDVGGIMGRLSNDQTATLTFTNNVNNGAVLENFGSSSTGAFFGSYAPGASTTVTMSDNYYRNDHINSNAVTTNPVYEVVGEIEGKTGAELGIQGTYLNWDFTNIWGVPSGEAKLLIFNGFGGL